MGGIAGVGLYSVDIGLMVTDMSNLIISFILLICPSIVFATTAQILNVVMMAKASGTLTVTDDFNRANGGLGSNWSRMATGPMGTGTLIVDTNEVVSSVNNVDGVSYYNGTFANDQFAQVTLGSSPSYAGVVVRMTSAGNGYALRCYNSAICFIQKITGGNDSTLGVNFTGLDVANKPIKLTASGSTLEFFVNGVSQGTRTDSTYSSGYPGITATSNYTGAGPDSFVGGDL